MGKPIRKYFTDEEVLNAFTESNGKYRPAAEALSELKGVSVSAPALNYWIRKINEGGVTETDGIIKGPKILTLDIETAPLKASIWSQWQQFTGLNMIQGDWYILSWSAKWMHEDNVVYRDKRETWEDEDDLALCEEMWQLLDEADIILTQNGIRFDQKKLFARFLHHGMRPPSSFRHIDTLMIAKKHFAFTSNKLEYMTDKFCKQYKKLKHGKYPGFELWNECLKGNMEAWDEMEKYNIYDVLSLEELYGILAPWYKAHPNINLYYEDNKIRCHCGNDEFDHNGYAYTNLSKFDKFACTKCGAEHRGRVNLLSDEKRKSLRMNVL